MYMWQRRCGRSAYFSLDQNCIFFTGPKVHIFHWTRSAYFSLDQNCIFLGTPRCRWHCGLGLWAAWPSSSMLLFVCFVYIVPAAYSSGSARAASSGPTTRCPRRGRRIISSSFFLLFWLRQARGAKARGRGKGSKLAPPATIR